MTVSAVRVDPRPLYGEAVEAELGMTCVDCGGTLHPLSYPPEEGWEPGDVVAYRCPDCYERFDIVLPDLDDDDRS
jgi:hypothetical protein